MHGQMAILHIRAAIRLIDPASAVHAAQHVLPQVRTHSLVVRFQFFHLNAFTDVVKSPVE